MARVKCLECGKEISDQASTCPSCGMPRQATVKVEPKKKKVSSAISALRRRSSVKLSRVLPAVVVAMASAFFTGRNWPASSSERPLEVKCLVEAVKNQLAAVEASQREQGQAPLFELKDFEMEIQYVVRNSGGAKAEVVGIGTSLDSASERVQKLRLRWEGLGTQYEEIDPSLSVDLPEVKATIDSRRPTIGLDTCRA
jgi:hypothetical protein